MTFSLGVSLQNILVDCLRNSFLSNGDYPYVTNIDGTTDLDSTQIDFYRSYPKVLTSYPIGIVEVPTMDNLIRTFGGDLQYQTWGIIDGITAICNEIRGGMGEMDFTINITGNTPSERDKIADYVIESIRITNRNYLEDRGIDIMDCRKGSDTIKSYGSSYVYALPITCTLFAEWNEIEWTTGDILEEVALCNISIYSDLDGLSNI